MNIARVAEAFRMPGIDPRQWLRLAIIEAIKVDAAGAKADVLFVPQLEPETVAIGGSMVAGGGLHIPYRVDQLVVVALIGGNANLGGMIIGSVWDGGQPPPAAVTAHPDDVALVGPDGRTVRVLALGAAGKSVLGGMVVELGDEDATRGVARLNDTVTVTIPPNTIMIENVVPPFMPPIIPNPGPITLSGVITSASAKVRST